MNYYRIHSIIYWTYFYVLCICTKYIELPETARVPTPDLALDAVELRLRALIDGTRRTRLQTSTRLKHHEIRKKGTRKARQQPNTRETPSTEGKSLRHLTPRHCAAKLALPPWLSFEHAHGYGTFID